MRSPLKLRPAFLRPAILVAVCFLAWAAACVQAVAADHNDRVLTVGFDPAATAADRVKARTAADVVARRSLAAPGLQHVRVPPGRSLAAAAAKLRADDAVSFVQMPGTYRKLAPVIPNDPYFEYLWGHNNTGQVYACTSIVKPCPESDSLRGTADADIDAPEAWEIWPGPAAGWAGWAGARETVGVVDTGVAYQHEDLAANIDVNAAESGGVAGVDDDPYVGVDLQPRSYIDDVNGWDFIDGDNDPRDPDGHGTHVAGIAAAAGENVKGVTGVNPLGKILPLRAGDANGEFTFAAIEEAFSYAVDHGVRVINGSFGGTGNSPGLTAIVDANPDVLFVFAAGNSGRDHDAPSGGNHAYPCDIPAPNVICVAASDADDRLAGFSDYGYDSVDLAAPGSVVLGTVPDAIDAAAGGDDDYDYLDGTSMATPQVAGAISLLWSAYPALDSKQVKTLVLTNVDQKTSLSGLVGFSGRLNIFRSLAAAANPPASQWPETPPQPTISSPGGPVAESAPAVGPIAPAPDLTPPSYRIVSPRRARLGRTGTIRFTVVCGEYCKIHASGRTQVFGAAASSVQVEAMAGRMRTVKIKIPVRRARTLRRALIKKKRLRFSVSLTVSDLSGNRAATRNFKIRLVR
ncbi:MAG: S8 family peptidase [Solirubrobacterales bacterium]